MWEFRKEIFWESAVLLVSFLYPVLRGLYRTRGRIVLDPLLADMGNGALLMAGVALAIYLWHLFIVTPARVHRDLLDKLATLETTKTEQESARAAEITKRPNLSVGFTDKPVVTLRVTNNGGMAEKLYVNVDPEANNKLGLPHRTWQLRGSGESLLSGGERTFEVASAGSQSSGKISEWRLRIDDHEHPIHLMDIHNPPPRRVSITISVTSHPENRDGPIRWRLTFHTDDVDKELITPSPAPPSANPSASTASE